MTRRLRLRTPRIASPDRWPPEAWVILGGIIAIVINGLAVWKNQ